MSCSVVKICLRFKVVVMSVVVAWFYLHRVSGDWSCDFD